MAKITKQLALQVAQTMSARTYGKQIQDLKAQTGRVVRNFLQSQLPDEVLQLFLNHPKYLKTITYFYFPGYSHRFSYTAFFHFDPLPEPVIINSETKEYNEVKEYVWTQTTLVEQLTEKKEVLKTRIEETLLQLGTIKRVQQEFPEAYIEIPEEYKTKPKEQLTPSIPLEQIRKELSQKQ